MIPSGLWYIVYTVILFSLFNLYGDTKKQEASDPQVLLQLAIKKDSPKDIGTAVTLGARLNFDISGKSPLLYAVLLNKKAAVEALLKEGANPNIIYRGKPLIQYLLQEKKLDLALLFINHKADFSGVVADGKDAFTYVVSVSAKPTNNAVATKNKQGGVDKATYKDVLIAMVKRGYSVDGNFLNPDLGNNAWYLALMAADTEMINFFTNDGKTVEQSPSLLRARANVNQLMTDKNKATYTPLMIALMHFEKEIIPLAMKSAYHRKNGYILNFIKLLVELGADVNQKAKPDGIYEWSPLAYLLSMKYPDAPRTISTCIDFLIDSKANLSEAITILVQNKLPPTMLVNGLWSLLSIAITKKDMPAVELLLRYAADVNQQAVRYGYGSSDKKVFPLDTAFAVDAIDIIELLLGRDAHCCAS